MAPRDGDDWDKFWLMVDDINIQFNPFLNYDD